MKTLIKVAAYVRMSSDEQDKSPEQQRKDLQAWAITQGYQIVAWFEDHGTKGDSDRRPEFDRMIAGALSGDFQGVVAWKQDRLSRKNSMQIGWVAELADHNVFVHTIVDGKPDISTMIGRISIALGAEMANKYLSDLSVSVKRGHRQSKDANQKTTGQANFGYATSKTTRKMVKVDDSKIRRAVPQVFEKGAAGFSDRDIALWLNSQGIFTTRGNAWRAGAVKDTFRDKCEEYLGHTVYDRYVTSRFDDPTLKGSKRRRNPPELWDVRFNTHEGYTDKSTVDKWKAAVDARSNQRGPNTKRTYPLRGLVRCMECGGPMGGKVNSRNNKQVFYQCKANADGSCKCSEKRRVYQRDLLPIVCEQLRAELFDKYLSPQNIDLILEEMERLLIDEQGSRRNSQEHLESELAELNAAIETATVNLMSISSDLRPLVEAKLREKIDQRDRIASSLDDLTTPVGDQLAGVKERIDAALQWMTDLETLVADGGDDAAIGRLISQFIIRIEVLGEKIDDRYECAGGRIYYNTDVFPQWAVPEMSEFTGKLNDVDDDNSTEPSARCRQIIAFPDSVSWGRLAA